MTTGNVAFMHFRRTLVLGLLSLSVACSAEHRPKSAASKQVVDQREVLPLVRVRLYSSGVGYFERHGDVSAGQHMLPVPLGHLDDALKSLVLLSAGSEPLSLSFPSRVSPAVARARAGLPAAENAAISYDRLLAALRGEAVRVTLLDEKRFGTSKLEGRVVEVVSVEPSHPSYDHGPVGQRVAPAKKAATGEDGEEGAKPTQEVTRLQLILLSETWGVIRLDVSELASVRPLDPRIAERFEAALAARIATRANPTQWLELAQGKSQIRDLRLGYLAETPIWRTSYRVRIEDAGRAELQAWALLHNDTDEAWRNVKVELVDGTPSSWLYPLAAPRYERRELLTPDQELSSVPQLSTTTPDAMWGDFSDYQGELVESISADETGGGGGTGSGQGFGSGHGRLGGSHKTRAPKVRGGTGDESASDLLWVGDLQKQAGVIPPAERAVSVFEVKSAIDLLPQHSALLPFLQQQVSAKTIVWFSSMGAAPERAIGLTNNTVNTLPEGPMSVFGSGGFLGEAILSSLQPGARQFARIGEVSDIDLSSTGGSNELLRRHVDFWNDSLRTHAFLTDESGLVFNNRSGKSVEVYLGLGIVSNATVQGSDRLDLDTALGRAFAVFDVPAGPGKERRIKTTEGIARSQSVQELGLEQLDELIADSNLPAEERAILTRARGVLSTRLRAAAAAEELEVELSATKEGLESLKQASREVASKESKEAGTVMTNRVLEGLDQVRKLEAKKRILEKDLSAQLDAIKAVLTELNAFRPKLIEERKRAEAAAKVTH